MGKFLKRAVILLLIYVVAVAGMMFFSGREKEDLTTTMAEATMPIMYMSYNGMTINELHGYSGEMDALSMRDSITPLMDDCMIPITIDTYGQNITSLTYEVRSLSGDRLVQDGSLAVTGSADGRTIVNLQLQKLMNEEEEYVLKLGLVEGAEDAAAQVSSDSSEASPELVTQSETADAEPSYYYYTRIVQAENYDVDEGLDLVTQFHAQTMDPSDTSYIATFLEPDDTEKNTSLQKTSIHSALSQVIWANFNGSQVTDPIITVKELNNIYNVFTIDYVMSTTGSNGQTEYYNVKEYYRTRMGIERMYLLNYERTVEQIFDAENQTFDDNNIQLGICSPDIKYYSNTSGKNVCFVEAGDLWTFNGNDGKLTQVFSFHSMEGIDQRENYDQHDISIQNIDEEGNIDFVVYGYMNRGLHQGEVGISVCRYQASSGMVEEELYIQSDTSYQVMKEKMCRLLYVGNNGNFYFASEGTIYRVNLETKEQTELVKGLGEDDYQVSEDGRYLAWALPGDTGYAETMSIMDLNTEEVSEIRADSNSYIKPLTFMGTDIVYGCALTSDIANLQSDSIFPMYRTYIADGTEASHEIYKTYEKTGVYVTGASVEGDTIYLSRAKQNNNCYAEIDIDTIVSQEEDKSVEVALTSYSDEQKQLQYQIQMPESIKVRKVRTMVSTWAVNDDNTVLEVEQTPSNEYYYAFAKGEVVEASANINLAIRAANDEMGVVVDKNQHYVWKRAKRSSVAGLSVAYDSIPGDNSKLRAVAILEARAGETVHTNLDLSNMTRLASTLNANSVSTTWLDLSGCRLEEMCYYVSQGNPVMVGMGSEALLLIGYNSEEVVFMNPMTGETATWLMEDAAELVNEYGNIFFTYIKNVVE